MVVTFGKQHFPNQNDFFFPPSPLVLEFQVKVSGIMPLSKPVKKQQLILPSPSDFNRLSFDKKELILRRLSTDNLIFYLEHIVNSYQYKETDQRYNECFTLEQIVEEDVRGSGGGAGGVSGSGGKILDNWLKQNANRNPDLEASFLEQNGSHFGMSWQLLGF